MRHTKIIATIGPSSDSDEIIRAFISAGVDVFRLNFSHGTHETHGAAIARIRAAAEQAGRYVAIMQDLGGPKIRTGELKNHQPIELEVRRHAAISSSAISLAAKRKPTASRWR